MRNKIMVSPQLVPNCALRIFIEAFKSFPFGSFEIITGSVLSGKKVHYLRFCNFL